ncbi:MAG: outer membrane lipoprotein-sorting protein [Acidobacteriota bacterium]|nr:outer membrane lipoprotein-sorting protein [Acidobacteriota bacterium]
MPLLVVLGFAGWGLAVGSAQTKVPALEVILARMAQARSDNQMHLRPYSVTRNYRLLGAEKQTRSEVIADVSFVPPAFKKFAIQKSSGIGLGERIVRQMLEHETAIAQNNNATDMTAANYDFRFLRQEELNGQPCYVLEILPLRSDKILLRGQIWVDALTYLLRRTEGAPGKAPSWWLRDARIALVYGEVEGMWLQTASESTADVRFLGRHTMLSRDVRYQVSEVVARASSAVSSVR